MNPTRIPSLDSRTRALSSRREFLAAAAGIAAAAPGMAGATSRAAEQEVAEATAPRFPIIGFSKPFQTLNAEETADRVAEVGWDGIECPVRARGQIEPERVADDLPQFAGVLRQRKLDVPLVATDITSMETPHAERVLRTLAQLNIRRLRLGFFTYGEGWPPDRLKEIAPALRDIMAACRDLGLQAGFQNHSGRQYVGAAVWDVFSMIRDLDPRYMGYCFDIGHATLEGGLSWPTAARLAEPFFTAIIVKDFYWKRTDAGWKDTWCPLGEGMVDRKFFDFLKKTKYRGPICQHHEYPLGQTPDAIAHFQQDLKVLKTWLA